jgi:hypothetical protein
MWWIVLGLAIVAVWCVACWIEEHLPMNDKPRWTVESFETGDVYSTSDELDAPPPLPKGLDHN